MSRDRELLAKWANTARPFDRVVWVDDGVSIADIKRAARAVLVELDERAQASTRKVVDHLNAIAASSRFTSEDLDAVYCRGGCSRGGEGPACGKAGCQG